MIDNDEHDSTTELCAILTEYIKNIQKTQSKLKKKVKEVEKLINNKNVKKEEIEDMYMMDLELSALRVDMLEFLNHYGSDIYNRFISDMHDSESNLADFILEDIENNNPNAKYSDYKIFKNR